jgi:hypothetical protein
VFEHKGGLIEGFTKTYGVKTLVYFEEWPKAQEAIHREKRLKKWPRVWKINLIRTDNPDWNDLAARWYPKRMTAADLDKWLVGIAESTRQKLGRPDALSRAPGDDDISRAYWPPLPVLPPPP